MKNLKQKKKTPATRRGSREPWKASPSAPPVDLQPGRIQRVPIHLKVEVNQFEPQQDDPDFRSIPGTANRKTVSPDN